MNPLFYQVETFSHPELGDIKGRVFRQDESNEVVHFRSIPYATIPGRFKPCVLLDKIPSTFDHRPNGDFSEYGNACPSVHQPDSAYGGPLPGQTRRTYDEQTCLNLTISAPRSAVLTGQRNHGLPVMVYIHGGAFKEGAGHISALHGTTHMVGLSATENRPVIIVNIGYRLNWFGFMNCRDLIDEHLESSDEAYPFNLGIHDQRTAFQWIHKHIGGFGGNASNITAFGESAGSGSIAVHLASDLPIFKRAIMMSGNFGIMRSATLASHDESYWTLLEHLNIDFETREERLEALRAVPASKLVEAINALPHVSFSPYLGPDNEMFTRGIPSYSTQDSIISSCPWVSDIMLGDCLLEGWIFMPTKAPNLLPILSGMEEAFGPHAAAILKRYGLDPDAGPISSTLLWAQSAALLGDLVFSEPTHRLADALAGSVYADVASATPVADRRRSMVSRRKVYRYQLCATNPFPGSPWSFVPHHFVDMLFLFLTLRERYPRSRDRFYARQATEMARKWVAFANGGEPWGEYVPGFKSVEGKAGEGRIAVFDNAKGWEVRTRKEDEERSRMDVWGERRYEGMEMITRAFEAVGDGEDGDERERVKRIEGARRTVFGMLAEMLE